MDKECPFYFKNGNFCYSFFSLKLHRGWSDVDLCGELVKNDGALFKHPCAATGSDDATDLCFGEGIT